MLEKGDSKVPGLSSLEEDKGQYNDIREVFSGNAF